MFKAKSLNLDRHAARFIEELHLTRCGIRFPMLHPGVTPQMTARTTVNPELVDAGRHVDSWSAVFSRFRCNRSPENL